MLSKLFGTVFNANSALSDTPVDLPVAVKRLDADTAEEIAAGALVICGGGTSLPVYTIPMVYDPETQGYSVETCPINVESEPGYTITAGAGTDTVVSFVNQSLYNALVIVIDVSGMAPGDALQFQLNAVVLSLGYTILSGLTIGADGVYTLRVCPNLDPVPGLVAADIVPYNSSLLVTYSVAGDIELVVNTVWAIV